VSSQLFRDFKNLVEKCIVVNVVDVFQSADSSSALDAVYAPQLGFESTFNPSDAVTAASVPPSLVSVATSGSPPAGTAQPAEHRHLSPFQLSR
jgi:hypothetical protein